MEDILRDTAEALDHLWRVAREVTFQYLKHAPWVLKSAVFFILARILRFTTAILAVSAAGSGVARLAPAGVGLYRRALIKPALRVILLLLGIPAREQAVEIFGIAEIVAQD